MCASAKTTISPCACARPRLRAADTPRGSVGADEVNAFVGSLQQEIRATVRRAVVDDRISLSAGRVAWNCSTVRCNRTDSFVAGRITLIRAG